MCACVCVPLYVRVTMCVDKVINIDKYKPNRDDVTCNIKVEKEIGITASIAVSWTIFAIKYTQDTRYIRICLCSAVFTTASIRSTCLIVSTITVCNSCRHRLRSFPSTTGRNFSTECHTVLSHSLQNARRLRYVPT